MKPISCRLSSKIEDSRSMSCSEGMYIVHCILYLHYNKQVFIIVTNFNTSIIAEFFVSYGKLMFRKMYLSGKLC